MSDYETTVRRVERAAGRQMKDHEVIVFLAEEVQELREKVKAVETVTTVDAEFKRFREEAFKAIIEIYELLDNDEQHIFDLGEVYGRLKNIEEELVK